MACQSKPANINDNINDNSNVKKEILLLSIAENINMQTGSLHLFVKESKAWEKQSAAFPVSYGKKGLAWVPEHWPQPSPEKINKKEGDLRSPAGIFQIGTLFGRETFETNCPFEKLHNNLQCIEDVQSKWYNDIVDHRIEKDWNSTDVMLRSDGLFDFGFFLEHNLKDEKGKGSCVFFHIWGSENKATAGCTAMSRNDMKKVLHFLDCDARIRVIQCPKEAYRNLSVHGDFPKLFSE